MSFIALFEKNIGKNRFFGGWEHATARSSPRLYHEAFYCTRNKKVFIFAVFIFTVRDDVSRSSGDNLPHFHRLLNQFHEFLAVFIVVHVRLGQFQHHVEIPVTGVAAFSQQHSEQRGGGGKLCI